MLSDSEFGAADETWIRNFSAAAQEGPTLEFKETYGTSDADKKELAKDVSALANGVGGSLIVGVREDPPGTFAVVGTNPTVGRQPTDQWIENVVAGGVRPRVTFRIRAVPLASTTDVVILIQVPQSAIAPHMVEFQGENRYYLRRGTTSAPANSNEVADMYERSRLAGEARTAFLRARGLTDPFDGGFSLNYDSTRLEAYASSGGGPETAAVSSLSTNPKVVIAYAPETLHPGQYPLRTDRGVTFAQNLQQSLPIPSLLILPPRLRTTLDGLYGDVRVLHAPRPLLGYLRAFTSGYLEIGLTDEFAKEYDGRPNYHLTFIVAAVANFLGALAALHTEFELAGPGDLIVALPNTAQAELAGFADGWSGAARGAGPHPAEPGLLIARRLDTLELDRDAIRAAAYSVGDDIEAAWGNLEPRYLSRSGSRPGQLAWGLAL